MNTREDYDGIISKPEMKDLFIEHGLLQKAHKYIDKYMKNGKWIYKYKSKAQEAGAKVRRKIKGYDDESTSVDIRKNPRLMSKNSMSYMNSQSMKAYVENLSGKASSYSGQHGSNVKSGTEAGRKRAKKAAITKKFNQLMNRKAFPSDSKGYGRSYASSFRTKNKNGVNRKYINPRSGSTRGQGYSSSIGSADNNKATAKVLRNNEAAKRAKKNRKAK